MSLYDKVVVINVEEHECNGYTEGHVSDKIIILEQQIVKTK